MLRANLSETSGYTLKILYPHTKYNYGRKQIANKPHGAIFLGHKTVTIEVVYHCPNITKESNEKIQNAIREVSKGD